MKTMTGGECKAQFSEDLKEVAGGEKVAITYGKQKEIKALLVAKETTKPERQLGILKGKESAKFVAGNNNTEEEFLGTMVK